MNQFLFFALLLLQYIVLFEFQSFWKKHSLLKPLVVLFVIQDWIMNWVMSLWFLDPPAKLNELVTGRMKRYVKKYGKRSRWALSKLERWRYGFAVRLCKILNLFDPDHCKQ